MTGRHRNVTGCHVDDRAVYPDSQHRRGSGAAPTLVAAAYLRTSLSIRAPLGGGGRADSDPLPNLEQASIAKRARGQWEALNEQLLVKF